MKKGVPMFSFFLIACYCYCGKQRRQTIRVSLVHISPRLYQSPHRHMEVLRAMVQAGVDVNKADTNGWMPLFGLERAHELMSILCINVFTDFLLQSSLLNAYYMFEVAYIYMSRTELAELVLSSSRAYY